MMRLKRWIFRIVLGSLGWVLLILLAGFTYEQIGRSHDNRDVPRRIGQAVDGGGRTLNLHCSGEGSATVILETGGNSPGYKWMAIQTKLATFTRACWYDRAGVASPYVLVGASMGGGVRTHL